MGEGITEQWEMTNQEVLVRSIQEIQATLKEHDCIIRGAGLISIRFT